MERKKDGKKNQNQKITYKIWGRGWGAGEVLERKKREFSKSEQKCH